MKHILPKRLTITFVFFIFSAILIILFIGTDRLLFSAQVKKTALNNAVGKTVERETYFKNFLSESNNLLSGIAESKPFQNYLVHQNIDIEPLFFTLAKSNSLIMQLRYIDKSGMEKIRVDRQTIGDTPFVVEQNKLQNKADRYYFSHSLYKPLNKVWFSKLDLNIEHNQVEKPYKPTLRAIYPISDNNGHFNGILIVNYFMSSFLDQFFNAPLYDMILTDKAGYPLIHYQKNKNWGFYQSPQYNIHTEFPQQIQAILTSTLYQDDSIVARKLNIPLDDELFLILQLKKSYLAKEDANTYNEYLIISLIVLILSFFVSWFLSGMIRKVLESRSRLFTKLAESRKLLQETLDEQQALLEVKTTGFVHIKNRHFVWTNETFETILGYERGELQGKPTRIIYFDEEEYQKYGDQCTLSLPIEGIYSSEIKAIKKDGTPVILIASLTALKNTPNEAMGVAFDITEQKNTEQKLQESLSKNTQLLNIIDNYVSFLKVNLQGFVTDISTSFLHQIKCKKEQIIGEPISILKSDFTPKHLYKEIWSAIASERTYTFEVLNKNFENEPHWYRVTILPEYDHNHTIVGYIAFYENIDEQMIFKNNAETDKLTGLANRVKIDEMLLSEQLRANRHKQPFSIILADIDLFKDVNDHFGHQTGDLILQEFAQTISDNIRKTDFVGRWGGEEFLIICPHTDLRGATALAENLRATIMAHKFSIIMNKTASFGVSQYSDDQPLEALFKNVDDALYQAKETGRNKVVAK
ncbi:MAG: diguanylate cyclase [Sulfuricurvum sp.]|uniref:sensor domain-containing diguanylate cyclase n=1 Tax=Sulfuricurvum sp. TaxID=2025608 RepID=UPI0026349F21|nr:diguanylate cyclase [Sulfuricurvum sp.]MDD2829890.1 diguanylate cyclase [Sulfuricurvum sp.]MDD4949540.1 diguanylate cyclase [Sulfuricurvum sp.]